MLTFDSKYQAIAFFERKGLTHRTGHGDLALRAESRADFQGNVSLQTMMM